MQSAERVQSVESVQRGARAKGAIVCCLVKKEDPCFLRKETMMHKFFHFIHSIP